jgi:hypothetical protein
LAERAYNPAGAPGRAAGALVLVPRKGVNWSSIPTDRSCMEDSFPDLGSLSDTELKDLIDKLTEEEEKVSYRRRILHGKIDILRAELVNRLRKKREEGESVITGADVQQLTDILAGRAVQEADDREEP